MRFGVVLFDDVIRKKAKGRERSPKEGWASVDGAPARRITEISELESNAKWLTNLGYDDFFSNLLGRHPNLYPSYFLRTDLKAIAEDVGANVENLAADKSAQALSTVFNRVMYLAMQTTGLKFESGTEKTLADCLSARFINKYRLPDELNEAMKHAYQTSTACMQRFPKDWKNVTLRRPRYQHALDILETGVPSEYRWVYLHHAKMPTEPVARIDWCLANPLPVLANVAVKPKRGELSTVISYGSGVNVERAWVSQIELLWISQFCDVDVIGAFVCEAGYEQQKELETFPALGDFSHASYSLGLLAENYWVSMANPRTNALNQKFYPPRAIWYRSVDRFSMFMNASKLHHAGFHVVGYGVGSVWLAYPVGATEDLIELAGDCGLDVPVAKFAELRNEKRLEADE